MNSCQTLIVVSALAASVYVASCGAQPSTSPAAEAAGKQVAPGVLEIGYIRHPRITESSGIVASRQFPGVFWTHNDGGGGKKQVLYAMTRDGQALTEFAVGDVLLTDWEDIATDDEKHLYIADTGNNEQKRTEVAVYQIDEPDPKANVRYIAPKRTWRLRFPGEPFDCESLVVWQGSGYVISKVFKDARAQIFRFSLTEQKEPATLELVATTKIESPVTGADISPNGKLLGIVAKSGAFAYVIDGDVSKAGKGKPHQTKFKGEHIEACTFVPEGLLATTERGNSERGEIYLFTDEAFRWK